MYRIHHHNDAGAFLNRAEEWLLQAEAEHNLILGLAHQLTVSTEAYEPPIYLATVEADGAVVGCAFRTPPYKLGLTRMPEAALPALVQDLASIYDWIPAALGPEHETATFAALWSEAKGIRAHPGMRQRIYQLDTVTPPVRMPPGQARLAQPTDVDLLARWLGGFREDTSLPGPDTRIQAELLLAKQCVFLWEDGAPASMAGWTGRTRHGARVGYVYTPPEQRGNGYASALTAALSQHLLGEGLLFCFLYTDLANSTSNNIYQRIGYYPVCDVMDYDFEQPSN